MWVCVFTFLCEGNVLFILCYKCFIFVSASWAQQYVAAQIKVNCVLLGDGTRCMWRTA